MDSTAVVVDVRSPEEYAAAHIKDAINLPLDELASRATELPRDILIVIACGKGGGRSDQGALTLMNLGFEQARPLCGGTLAWLAFHDSPNTENDHV